MRIAAGAIALTVLGITAPGAAAETGPGFAPDLPARSAPGLATGVEASGTNTRRQLRRKLEKLARRAPSKSGFHVSDLEAGGGTLFDRRGAKRRKLASNTKLFTTATALDRFGADGVITTAVASRGRIDEGRLRGNLYLIGAGDPSFGKDGIKRLARQVRRAGIRRVEGRLYADDSVFDRRRGVPDSGWGPSPYIAPLSGLTYSGSTYSGDPALHAAEALKRKLRKRGVKVKGGIALKRAPAAVEAEPIASSVSPPISALAADTNKPSNNFYAEMLLKRTAAGPDRRGTTKRGTAAVERFARSLGSRVDSRDGSGLTDRNRSSPRDVVGLLRGMLEHEAGDAFRRSLPKVGKEGTVDARMEGTPAARRCRAKTGTISGVSALSGYCRSGAGTVAFSLLMNGVSSYDAARSIQDRMTIEIAKYRPGR